MSNRCSSFHRVMLLGVVLATAATFAQDSFAQAPAVRPAGATSRREPSSVGKAVRITSVEGITQYDLPNGMRVLLFPDQSKPTVTVNITYLVGSRHEGTGEAGMAHFLEHLVFKGSPKHRDIPQELTEHGAQANGTTWYDVRTTTSLCRPQTPT